MYNIFESIESISAFQIQHTLPSQPINPCFVYLFVYLFVCLFICLFVCLFMYFFQKVLLYNVFAVITLVFVGPSSFSVAGTDHKIVVFSSDFNGTTSDVSLLY